MNVAPFTIAIDTREQLPYAFEGLTIRKAKQDLPLIIPTIRSTLQTGDYSIVGLENCIAVERKSTEDLVRTIASDRQRFERELERMQELDWACVLVEETWENVLLHCAALTAYNPVALDASIMTFQMRYPRTHWVFRPSRYTAMKTTFKILDIWNRKFANGK